MKIKPNQLRKHVLNMVFEKKSGHIGGSFSIAELVAYLYSNFNLIEDGKDKLILSKGHAVPILYAALYELGCINNLNDFILFSEGSRNIYSKVNSMNENDQNGTKTR